MEIEAGGITRWAKTDIKDGKVLGIGLDIKRLVATGIFVPLSEGAVELDRMQGVNSQEFPIFIVTADHCDKSNGEHITICKVFGSRGECRAFLVGLKAAFELVGGPEVELPEVPHTY